MICTNICGAFSNSTGAEEWMTHEHQQRLQKEERKIAAREKKGKGKERIKKVVYKDHVIVG